ncbi:uncharacterized protein LOC132701724 [Cylas formicarius]|uniref:uncharacterized protein LOC132701724 n=1 Tax=Cylas formicarius TaxID=197179 RepID=UPI0029585EDB|nr:uncharacterized protein LOC132701724 [Cylas formicarius]
MTLTVACRATDQDKHRNDVNSLLFHKGKLYSGGDDGLVKVWSDDLVKQQEVQAHASSVYSLAASEDSLYSCSNDGTVKQWDLNTLAPKGTLIDEKQKEFYKLVYAIGRLFVADNEGNVNVYKDNKYQGQVDVAENVKDLVVSGHFIFTVKDLDLIVAEIKLDGDSVQYGYKAEFMGRAPVTLIGDKLLAFVAREGKEILLHQNSEAAKFGQAARIAHGSELIINALAGAQWGNEEVLFSGGWDKLVRKWKIRNGSPSDEGSANVDIVVNSLATGSAGSVYAGGSDGHLVRVDVS